MADGAFSSELPTTRDRSWCDPWLLAVVLLGALLAIFRLALDSQLQRLHDHRSRGFGYGTLHGDNPERVKDVWAAGMEALQEFEPTHPVVLVRALVGLDVALAVIVAGGAFLVAYRRRAETGVLRRLSQALPFVIGLHVLATVAVALCDLAIVRTDVEGRYQPLFPWLDRATLWSLVAVGSLVVLIGGKGLRAGWTAYRRSPATARLAVALAVAFAVVLLFGNIGAQSEDALRRALDESSGLALLRVFGGIALFVVVVSIVRTIAPRRGTPPTALTLLAAGAVLLVAGLGVTWALGGHASLVVLGALVLAVGGGSALVERKGVPPAQDDDGSGRSTYVAAALIPPIALAALTGRLLAGEVATHGDWQPLALLEAALLGVAILSSFRFHIAAHGAPLPAPAPPNQSVLEQAAKIVETTTERVEALGRFRFAFLVVVALVPPGVAVAALASDGVSTAIGHTLGSLTVLLVVLAALVAACGVVRVVAIDADAPALFPRLGMRRTPVVVLLLMWFLLTAAPGSYLEVAGRSPHIVRFVDRDELPGNVEPNLTPPDCPDASTIGLALGELAANKKAVARHLCNWLYANARTADAPASAPVPLVLVSASGGGVRAATWTARVADCLFFAPPPGADPCGDGRVAASGAELWRNVFAAGGASGGSVGLMSATAQRVAGTSGDNDAPTDWIRRLNGPDHVAPLVSQLLLAETGLGPFGIAPDHDRAEVLIDGWVDAFDPVDSSRCQDLADRDIAHVGFLEMQASCPDEVPLLLLNGTMVANGRRFNISPLDGSETDRREAAASWTAGSVDLLDVLCDGQDLRAFDAAFLSARFPFVTPSGRILSEGSYDGCDRDVASGVDVVDGGYRENSGAAQVHELWTVLRPLVDAFNAKRPAGYREVRTVFVQIENGEAEGILDREPGAFAEVATLGPAERRPIRGDDDIGASVGEPLRPAVAGIHMLLAKDPTGGVGPLIRALCQAGVPVIKMALQEHPGKALPLGWALSTSILNDIDAVYRLEPLQDGATALRAIRDGAETEPSPSCRRRSNDEGAH